MEKNIKDYLHLYLGCDIKTETGIVKLYAVTKEIAPCTEFGVIVLNGNVTHKLHNIEGCKLFLRPLSAMTDEESSEHDQIETVKVMIPNGYVVHDANAVAWLLSKHFDLFGLIPAGLAIDATTINKKASTNE